MNNVYVECRYCRSCWWRLLFDHRGRRTSWWLCRKCRSARDDRTGHTLYPHRLN